MSPRLSGYSVHVIFPFRRVSVPAFVISQVALKESLAVDPMHRAVIVTAMTHFINVKV
jgi:hypothetical protein